MDLQHARKVAGDQHSSTFEMHDGRKFHVIHSLLPALQRKKMEAMPVAHLDDGGSPVDGAMQAMGAVDDTQNQTPAQAPQQNDPSPAPAQQFLNPPVQGPSLGGALESVGNWLGQTNNDDDGADPDDGQKQALDNQVAAAPPPSPDADAAQDTQQQSGQPPDAGAPVQQKPDQDLGLTSSLADPNKFFTQGQAGIEQQANVEKQMSDARVRLDQNHIKALTELQSNQQTAAKEMEDSFTAFKKDFGDGKIDPKHYMQSMSTGQKVATAVGLFLGGWSSAYTHQGNPAQDFLNKQIDRDIESQKASYGNKRTLFEANMQHYRDQSMALNATRMQENEIYGQKIAQAADQLGTPAAEARKNMALSKFGLQNFQLLNQNAMRAAALKQNAQGGNGLKDPSVLVPSLVPKEHQQKVFDEIEAAQSTATNAPRILKAFDNAANKLHAVDLVPGMENVDQKALHTLMGPTFKDIENTVRQAAMDNVFHNVTPQFVDAANTIKVKRESLVQYLSSKQAAPTAKGFGIDLSRYPTTSTQGFDPKPQHKVGDIIAIDGKPVRIIDSSGRYKAVK